jgi:diguanylate cyclase (GGDEF)-like protein
MMEHAALGETILVDGGNDSLRALAPLIRHHHEWFDGGGYPDGLAGEAIPLGAAIIAVADAFDTIVTDRPYRRRQSAARALDELRRSAGSQFRPDLVEALAAIVASTPAIVEPPPTGQSERPPTTPIAGRIGDARALSLLVELATLTRRIPDLAGFLTEVAAIVRRRLNYEDVYLHLVQRERGELMLLGHDGETPVVEPNHRQPLDAGVCGEVIRTGLASNIPDLSARPHVTQTCPIVRGSELWVPLMVEDEVIGIISVSSRRTAAFTSNDEAILSAVAGQVAAAINVAKLHDELRQAASTDGLTGLINHRVFYTKLDEAVAAGAPFSVVLFDVEGLKVVNDTFGHLAGDSLLRHIGTVIREHVRPADTVARYGGDEFAAILVGLDAEDAARSAARIRRQLCADDAPSSMTPTVRYGVASFPTDGRRPHDLVGVADRRLYQMRDRRARLAKIS